MQLQHSFTLPVGLDDAWRILRDVGSIAPYLPNSTVTSATPDAAEGSLKVKLGPLNVTYRGHARIGAVDETARRAAVEATGDSARSGSATATVTATLTADGSATTVTLVTELEVSGKPAQFGQAVMSDVGTKLVGRFATELGNAITAGTWTPSSEQPEPQPVPVPTPEPAPEPTPVVPLAEAEIEDLEAAIEMDAAVELEPDLPLDAEPIAAGEPAFVTPAVTPTATTASAPSANGHGSPTPSTAGRPATRLESLARPLLVRGVAPAAIAVIFVLGAFRRRRRRR